MSIQEEEERLQFDHFDHDLVVSVLEQFI